MVYMDTNKSNTHADPLLGSRWAQMWVHMWARTLVIFLVYVTKGNTYAWEKEKNCYMQRNGKLLTYTKNCKQKANIAVIKSKLKIPPGHNGVIPMKINGYLIKGHMTYFISDQDPRKGKDPNIHIVGGIHYIKGKTYVNILISNYTNKHITFNKGEYIEHLEPPIEEIQYTPANTDSLTNHVITIERMMAKKVEIDTFEPPGHKLKKDIESKLE